MARGKATFEVSVSVPITQAQILQAFKEDSEIQERVAAFVQGNLPKSGKKRASGGTPSGRVKRGLHPEMAIRALAACGATNKRGAVERASVMQGGINLGHDFGSTLSATLDALADKGIVNYEDVSEKGAKKGRYKWWLAKPEKDALEAIGN